MDKNFRHVRIRKRTHSRKLKAVLLLLLIVGLGILWSVLSSSASVFTYVFSPANALKSTNDRINILLLGNAGGTHDGAELTDSIIVASYNLKTRQATFISVPRDLWLDSIKNKVNAAYEIGKLPQNGGKGLKFAEDKIDDILGLPLHYGVRLDFNGFAKAIDLVGGIDVKVANAFDDYEFPITGKENDMCGYQDTTMELSDEQAKKLNIPPGKQRVIIDPSGNLSTDSATINYSCRFEHIRFDKGVQHMSGQTALDFVRSRKGTNGEGSDFARSKRQQLVIQAFREKVLSLQTLANPQKMIEVILTLGNSVETDIPTDKYLDLYNVSKKMDKTESIVLGDLVDGKSVLVNPPAADYGGAWVLVPPNNDFNLIRDYLKKRLADQDASSTAALKAT